jgi:peroxiredoxin
VLLGLIGGCVVVFWQRSESPVGERLGWESLLTSNPLRPEVDHSSRESARGPADGLAPGRMPSGRGHAQPGLAPLFATFGMHQSAEPAAALDFTLPDLEGRPVQLREFRGKLVLLNFWATWCAPCLHEMPSMERLYQTFKGTEFVLLAVSMDRQGAQAAKPYVENLQLTFPVLVDRTNDVGRRYGVRGLPSTYLIDPDGQLLGAVVGARDWHRAEAKALIAGILRQAAAPTADPPQVRR